MGGCGSDGLNFIVRSFLTIVIFFFSFLGLERGL